MQSKISKHEATCMQLKDKLLQTKGSQTSISMIQKQISEIESANHGLEKEIKVRNPFCSFKCSVG